MKADLPTMLRDIKAAARIGHTESVWAALEGLLVYPQIAGNHLLDESFLKQVILPVGQALAQPMLNPSTLRPLIIHTHAGMRAIAGVALAERYLKGLNGSGLKNLGQLAQDPRQDVRQAMLLACALPTRQSPERQTAIFEHWLVQPSPLLQALGWQLLPYLPEGVILAQLHKLERDHPHQESEVRRSIAEAVSKLGRSEYRLQVLAILLDWAKDPERYYWIITRSLSRSWAAAAPEESLAVLTRLAAARGGRKKILSTLAALERHGANTKVQSTLQDWQSSGNPHLQAAAQKAQKKNE